mmetsp:Transcript_74603/g.207357  ORF Transcript_74603/g.207357 Transcript_74603/m.207357 type:complete len:405 (+) Transcript_74603:48-1262(+)
MLQGAQLDWLFRCCTRDDNRDGRASNEIQVLSCETDEPDAPVRHRRALAKADSYDITFQNSRPVDPTMLFTPRQRDLRDRLELPFLQKYPNPPGCSLDEAEEPKREKLLHMYQEFVLEMHAGTYLTQLTSTRDYSNIHCQLMEDLKTLKLDQCNGRIIEFPLTGVSKVYRIVKSDDRLYSSISFPATAVGPVEHIIVVEFMRRKLAFVFPELHESQRFLLCMELLIRRAQQTSRGFKSTATPKAASQGGASTMTTPRPSGAQATTPPVPHATMLAMAGVAPLPQDGSMARNHVEQALQGQAPVAPRGARPRRGPRRPDDSSPPPSLPPDGLPDQEERLPPYMAKSQAVGTVTPEVDSVVPMAHTDMSSESFVMPEVGICRRSERFSAGSEHRAGEQRCDQPSSR